eukprot:UN33223
MLAVNTLFFNGTWTNPFSDKFTYPSSFYSDTYRTQPLNYKVNFMRQKEHFFYYEDPERQILKIPFADSQISFYIHLPKEETARLGGASGLSWRGLQYWVIPNMEWKKMRLVLPKFQFQSRYDSRLKD